MHSINDKTKFKIESIQRTKIIMAVEAVAVNTSVMIGIYLVTSYFESTRLTDIIIWLGGIFAISYSLYASIGNAKRHITIKHLEKLIDKKYT